MAFCCRFGNEAAAGRFLWGPVAEFGRSSLPRRTSRHAATTRPDEVERRATLRRGADVRTPAVRLAAKVRSGRKDLLNAVLSGRKWSLACHIFPMETSDKNVQGTRIAKLQFRFLTHFAYSSLHACFSSCNSSPGKAACHFCSNEFGNLIANPVEPGFRCSGSSDLP